MSMYLRLASKKTSCTFLCRVMGRQFLDSRATGLDCVEMWLNSSCDHIPRSGSGIKCVASSPVDDLDGGDYGNIMIPIKKEVDVQSVTRRHASLSSCFYRLNQPTANISPKRVHGIKSRWTGYVIMDCHGECRLALMLSASCGRDRDQNSEIGQRSWFFLNYGLQTTVKEDSRDVGTRRTGCC